MRTYIFLTVFWLVAAGLAFAYPWYIPNATPFTILGSDWSIGWLLLVFAAWNGVRFMMVSSAAKSEKPTSELPPTNHESR